MKLIEGMNVEFKKLYTKDAIKTIIAFANSSGGKLYIGVDDNGKVIGLENPDTELLMITNSIRDSVKPDVTMFTSSKIERVDDQQIIVFEVQKGTASPYYLSEKGIRPSGVYVRQGASSVPATDAAIIRMIRDSDGDNYEECRSLNQELEFKTLKNAFEEANVLLEESQMKTLQVIDEDGLYTNLGLLLSEQCQHTIKIAVFEGTTKELFKDRYEFSGSVISQMKEAYNFLDRYNRTQSEIIGLKRTDKRDYPEVAIRETLLNSIVHKDYAFSGSTLISVFEDRIEFVTIGGLVRGMSEDDILLGVSILRNKNLANILYRLKWIEAFGTGIQKTIESYAMVSVKPTINISSNAFKITLPNTSISKKENVVKFALNESEEKILMMFDRRDRIIRKDVEFELAISQPMAVKLLKSLLDKEVVIRKGQGKNVYYIRKE
jgi:ATP-dependent DNA helicase RecG